MRDDALHALAATLDALSNPTRLAILRELRSPSSLGDIRVGEGRTISRQAVRQHLDRLLDIGVVATVPAAREDRVRYVIEHRKLFAIAEEFRGLANLRPAEEVVAGRTEVVPPAARPKGAGAPRLVLVRGLREGTTFLLDAEGPRDFVIGRRRDADCPLDYDPFVSSQNAVVRRDAEGRFSVRDAPGSRNGTTVNFEPLEPGAWRVLQHGDVVGVGHTALVFWTR